MARTTLRCVGWDEERGGDVAGADDDGDSKAKLFNEFLALQSRSERPSHLPRTPFSSFVCFQTSLETCSPASRTPRTSFLTMSVHPSINFYWLADKKSYCAVVDFFSSWVLVIVAYSRLCWQWEIFQLFYMLLKSMLYRWRISCHRGRFSRSVSSITRGSM